MPTGFTARLYDGEDLSLREFMLICVRGMVPYRDVVEEPLPPPEITHPPSEITPPRDSRVWARMYPEIQGLRAELDELMNLSPEEACSHAEAEYQEEMERWAVREKRARARQARYEAMEAQVRAWVPPTPDHEGFKAFMLEQLSQSKLFDCPTREAPTQLSGEDWRSLQKKILEADIQYTLHRASRKAKTQEEARAWVEAFWQSLPPEE